MDINDILNHLGEDRSNYFDAISPPIIQSSNFYVNSIEEMREKIQDELSNHLYTRGNNPTVEILRKKIAALEGAEDCLMVSSGASAMSIAVLSQVKQNDHIVCINKPYSWTYKLLVNILPKFGITCTFITGKENKEFESAIQDNTRLIILESPNSLTFEIQDLRFIAQLARSKEIITIIDNSHCSPYFQNPINLGIDIVVHSVTKYLSGHSDLVMGAICGSSKIIRNIFSNEFMTLGTIVSPHDAFLAIRGLRTFKVRMQQIEVNAKKVFRFLKDHPKIRKIYYPLDPDSVQYELASSQMRGCGGLVSIELDTNSKQEVSTVVQKLDKFLFAVSWGGYESLKMPSLAFHDIPGVPDSPIPYQMIRLYIGLEDADYLIKNLDEALINLS